MDDEKQGLSFVVLFMSENKNTFALTFLSLWHREKQRLEITVLSFLSLPLMELAFPKATIWIICPWYIVDK